MSILIAKMITDSPTVIDYLWVYSMLKILSEETEQAKQACSTLIEEAHKENYDLEMEFTNSNLDDLGVDTSSVDEPTFDDVKSDSLERLVDKHFANFNMRVKSQILNCLNTANLEGVQLILQKELKDKNKAQSLVNKLMRAFRTESTLMRSNIKLIVQKNLKNIGINVKRKWVHTMNVKANVILDNYTPRGDHMSMDGQIESDNGYFVAPSGAMTQAPCMFGRPEEDINCRCDVEFVLAEE